MYKYRQHCLYIALIHSPVECNIGLHLPRWELGESVRLLSLFSVQAETIFAAGKDAKIQGTFTGTSSTNVVPCTTGGRPGHTSHHSHLTGLALLSHQTRQSY